MTPLAIHNIVKLLGACNIVFPISKKELLDRAGRHEIRTSPAQTMSLEQLCSGIRLTNFDNKAAFFNAFNAAHIIY